MKKHGRMSETQPVGRKWFRAFALMFLGWNLAAGSGLASAAPGADALDRSFGDAGSISHIFSTAPVAVNPVGIVPHGEGYRVWAGAAGDLARFEYRADGSLDPALDGRGFRLIEPIATSDNNWDIPRDVAVQGDREIIAGGTWSLTSDLMKTIEPQTIVRVRADGAIDRTFGHGGTVISRDLRPARRVVVDRHGRIVTMAQVPKKGRLSSKRFRPPAIEIARYHPNGRRDRTFAQNGVFRRSIDWGTRMGAIATDPAGGVLVAVLEDLGDDRRKPDRTGRLLRLDPDGRLDRAYGRNGSASLGSRYRNPRRMTVRKDGRLLVGTVDRNGAARVSAFDDRGQPDTTFGNRGEASAEPDDPWAFDLDEITGLTVFGGDMIAVSGPQGLRILNGKGERLGVPDAELPAGGAGVAVAAPDGSLVTSARRVGSPALGRLLPDLTTDQEFKANADHRFELRRSAGRFTEQAVGLFDGGFLLFDLEYDGDVSWYQHWVRLRPDGRVDTSYGENGFAGGRLPGLGGLDLVRAVLPRPGGAAWAIGESGRTAAAVVISRDATVRWFELEEFRHRGLVGAAPTSRGRVLALGAVWRHRNSWKKERTGFLLARYRADGKPDRRFGRRGRVQSFFPENSAAKTAVTDRRGRIIVAGGTCGQYYSNCPVPSGQRRVITVARYLPDGRLDRSFGENGYIHTGFGAFAGVGSMAKIGGGRIAISIEGLCGPLCFNLSRVLVLKRSGSVDRRFGRRGRVALRLGRSFAVHRVLRGKNGGVTLAGTLESCRGRPEFTVIRLDRRGRFDRSFGGGDGILDAGARNGVGASTTVVSRQKKGTLTLGGYAEVKGRYGGIEPAFGMVRFRLDGKDGKTGVRPCRI